MSSSPNHSATASDGTVRESFAEIVRERYPYFKPRTDFDVFALASGDYTGTPSGIYTWLDGQLAIYLALTGDMEAVMEETRQLLDRRGTITGVRQAFTQILRIMDQLIGCAFSDSANQSLVPRMSSFVPFPIARTLSASSQARWLTKSTAWTSW